MLVHLNLSIKLLQFCTTGPHYWTDIVFMKYIQLRIHRCTICPFLGVSPSTGVTFPTTQRFVHGHSVQGIHVTKVHCGSAFQVELGASWLPYYCAPPVRVPTVSQCYLCGDIPSKKRK